MTARMPVLLRALTLLGCFLCVDTTPSPAGNEQGSAQLDVLIKKQRYSEIVSILADQDDTKLPFLPWIQRQAEAGHVPLQFELSKYLALSNPSDALNWFAIARVGAMLDAALCVDKTAASAASGLIKAYGHHIRPWMTESRYRTALEYALRWHDQHLRRPSPAWICIHKGQAGQIQLIPESQWMIVQQDIKNKIRSSANQMGKQKGVGACAWGPAHRDGQRVAKETTH